MLSLQQFSQVDPDTLYTMSITHDRPYLTFFFTEDGKLWEKGVGSTHYGMLQSSDSLFKSVWGFDPNESDYTYTLHRYDPYYAKEKAIVGRAGQIEGQNVIALHNALEDPLIEPFLKAFFDKHPEYKESAVITSYYGSKPRLIGKLAQKTVSAPVKKVYSIAGKTYTRKEIADLLSAWHTQAWRRKELEGILCHPDIKNYPELVQLIPPGCFKKPPKKSMWQAIKQSFPVESTLNFKEWFSK
jgi:hypothetical protein